MEKLRWRPSTGSLLCERNGELIKEPNRDLATGRRGVLARTGKPEELFRAGSRHGSMEVECPAFQHLNSLDPNRSRLLFRMFIVTGFLLKVRRFSLEHRAN